MSQARPAEGTLELGYEIVSAIVKAIERLQMQPFAKLAILQSKKTDLVRDVFNWNNIFGLQFKLIYNKESTIDSDYYCRTLKFEATKPNSLNKARMDNPHDKLRR